eukprot:10790606-Alexandrium_andersonii.AAC.1
MAGASAVVAAVADTADGVQSSVVCAVCGVAASSGVAWNRAQVLRKGHANEKRVATGDACA